MANKDNSQSINTERENAIVKHFRKHIGKRVFILMEAFPFMFIGEIKSVIDDMAVLFVETTSVPALEKKEWSVHIHAIDVFYIETKLGTKIPELKDE